MYVEYLPGEKHAAKGAEVSTQMRGLNDAGYVLKRTDLVVDIDELDHEAIRAMLDEFGIRTETVWTERGAHLYFKKPTNFNESEAVVPLGFHVEYKHVGNSTSVTVKRNGVERRRENPNVRAILPDILKPQRSKFKESLVGLSEGDGRNTKLFTWANKVQTMKDKHRILRFINNWVFSDPLDNGEFESATRPRVLKAEKDMEGEIAAMMIKDLSIKLFHNMLYWKDETLDEYVTSKSQFNHITFEYCEGQKSRYVEEVIKQVTGRCQEVTQENGFPIVLDNGYFENGEFINLKYDGFTPYRIHTSYDPEAKPVPIVDDYIRQLTNNDEDYRKRLLEALAHGLITDPEMKRLLGRFFVFIGSGGNGKGTLLQVIREIFGDRNCASLTIEELQDERYFNTLEGKLFSLGDDLEDRAINNAAMRHLKNVSTCDTVQIRRLYENSYQAQMTATMIFTSNHLIKTFEKGESYVRRVDWMPMYTKPVKKDPKFISKLTTPEAIRYWMRLIGEAYFRLYNNLEFTESEKVSKFTENYHDENDNTRPYVNSLDIIEVVGRRAVEVYKDYKEFCESEGLKPASQSRFYLSVCNRFDLVKKRRRDEETGRPVYIFVRS